MPSKEVAPSSGGAGGGGNGATLPKLNGGLVAATGSWRPGMGAGRRSLPVAETAATNAFAKGGAEAGVRWETIGSTGAGGGKATSSGSRKQRVRLGAAPCRLSWMHQDGDPYFCQNPQFVVRGPPPPGPGEDPPPPCTVLLSLQQEDLRTRPAESNLEPLAMTVFERRREAKGRVWEIGATEVVATSQGSLFHPPTDGPPMKRRELVLPDIVLNPDASYVVVPHPSTAAFWTPPSSSARSGQQQPYKPEASTGARAAALLGISPPAEKLDPDARPFSLRVFSSSPHVDIRTLPTPPMVAEKGKWALSASTAKGAPVLPSGEANPDWLLGPQYLVTTTQRAPQKDVPSVGRQGSRSPTAGLSETAGSSTLGRTGRSLGRTGTRSGGKPSGLASCGRVVLKISVRRTDRQAGRDDRPDGVPNRVGVVLTRAVRPDPSGDSEAGLARTGTGGADSMAAMRRPWVRRRQLEKEEWVWSSDFHSPLEATATVRVPAEWLDPASGGVVVHPILRLPEQEGSFTVVVTASRPVELTALEEPGKVCLSGEWKLGATACGGRLHPDWLRNPSFELRPSEGSRTGGIAQYDVRLMRPRPSWRTQLREDSVGCMIGLYLLTCDIGKDTRLSDGRDGILAETRFVPMHEVSVSVEIDWVEMQERNKTVLILPATFEPGKAGPFQLEVESADAGFQVERYSG